MTTERQGETTVEWTAIPIWKSAKKLTGDGYFSFIEWTPVIVVRFGDHEAEGLAYTPERNETP